MDRWIALGIALFVSSGCSSYAVARYGVSVENVTTLRTLAGQKVSVGAFGAAKAGQTEIMCRAVGPIRTPDGKPFEDFIRSALVDELKVAEVLSEGASRTLTGRLNGIEFSSASGKWTLDVTLSSSNGGSLTVREVYDYSTSFVGEKACALTAQAFTPAVQSLIGKLVRSPEFRGLLE